MRLRVRELPGSLEALVASVDRRTGLNFEGAAHDRMLAALAQETASRDIHDYEGYGALLARDADIFHALVAKLTVGETYFFRERSQLELLWSEIAPDVVRHLRPGCLLEAWSAGCSTGEEAYTLAMVLDEAGLGSRSRVLGTDLSADAVAWAEKGVYRPWSLRAVRPDERERYFGPAGQGVRVEERIANRVRFAQRNLMDDVPPSFGRFHVIFCRNVLIYLTRSAIEHVAANLRESLAPGGWLVTSTTDPPLEVAGLERVRTPHGLAYRARGERVMQGAHSGVVSAPSVPLVALEPHQPLRAHVAPRAVETSRYTFTDGHAVAPDERPSVTVTADDRLTAAQLAYTAAHYGTAADLARQAVAAGAGSAGHVLLVRSLASGGRTEEAVSAAEEAADARPLDADLQCLLAILHLETARWADAQTAASAALYLCPDLAIAHVVRAKAARALGEGATAGRSLRNARQLLSTAPADEVISLGDGETVAHLLAVVDAEMARPSAWSASRC